MGILLVGIYLFVLSMFVGLEIIGKVPPTLHTPLMSGANAISGITIVGAIVASAGDQATMSNILGFLAITAASVNVIGGYLVTDRMLKMFRKK